jgi:hypothetical protein
MIMDEKTGQEGFIYAQLNDEDIAIGISHLYGEVNQDNMILVAGHEDPNALLGMQYSRDGCTWGPGPEPGVPPDGDVQAIIANASDALQQVQAVLPDLAHNADKASAFDQAVPDMLSLSIRSAEGDQAKARQIALAAAAAVPLLAVRDWQPGMATEPGDPVYGLDRDYVYLYSGKDPYTHSNPGFYPGASGVYYWSIVPSLYKGEPVFPDIPNIVVFTRQGSIWWNHDKAARYRWTGNDYDCPSVFYPGALGVHQWERVE